MTRPIILFPAACDTEAAGAAPGSGMTASPPEPRHDRGPTFLRSDGTLPNFISDELTRMPSYYEPLHEIETLEDDLDAIPSRDDLDAKALTWGGLLLVALAFGALVGFAAETWWTYHIAQQLEVGQ